MGRWFPVAVLLFAGFWVVKDPAGAADAVAHVASQIGILASTLTQHLSSRKPALPGVSAQMDQEERSA